MILSSARKPSNFIRSECELRISPLQVSPSRKVGNAPLSGYNKTNCSLFYSVLITYIFSERFPLHFSPFENKNGRTSGPLLRALGSKTMVAVLLDDTFRAQLQGHSVHNSQNIVP